ncbi:MAG: hypothetical protein NT027_12435 [Proteobacteria bacterium]|nr:hypothetical protein [Pseudomonadota bacterium]
MKVRVLVLGLACLSAQPIYGSNDSDFERNYQRNAYAELEETAFEEAERKIHEEAVPFRHSCEEYLDGTYDIVFKRHSCVAAAGGFVCKVSAVATCNL